MQDLRSKRQEVRSKKKPIKSYKDLKVYRLSYKLAIEIFHLSKKFPKEEIYSLTAQIRNSSRSVPANIAEGWAKRRYEQVFKRHLIDAIGSCEETKVWLDFSYDCDYIKSNEHKNFSVRYEEVSKMLNGLLEKWQTF